MYKKQGRVVRRRANVSRHREHASGPALTTNATNCRPSFADTVRRTKTQRSEARSERTLNKNGADYGKPLERKEGSAPKRKTNKKISRHQRGCEPEETRFLNARVSRPATGYDLSFHSAECQHTAGANESRGIRSAAVCSRARACEPAGGGARQRCHRSQRGLRMGGSRFHNAPNPPLTSCHRRRFHIQNRACSLCTGRDIHGKAFSRNRCFASYRAYTVLTRSWTASLPPESSRRRVLPPRSSSTGSAPAWM